MREPMIEDIFSAPVYVMGYFDRFLNVTYKLHVIKPVVWDLHGERIQFGKVQPGLAGDRVQLVR
jgi:hypothetical protein